MPFFLRGEHGWGSDTWLAERGLRPGASRAEINAKTGSQLPQKGGLFDQAGIDISHIAAARERSYFGDTMHSHRLAWHAAKFGKAENVWDALSRKWFEGKCNLPRIALDDRTMLMEVAEEAGLDLGEAARVLDDPKMYHREIKSLVESMHQQGINSIPVFIFQFKSRGHEEQMLHHGSGNKDAFKKVFLKIRSLASAPRVP